MNVKLKLVNNQGHLIHFIPLRTSKSGQTIFLFFFVIFLGTRTLEQTSFGRLMHLCVGCRPGTRVEISLHSFFGLNSHFSIGIDVVTWNKKTKFWNNSLTFLSWTILLEWFKKVLNKTNWSKMIKKIIFLEEYRYSEVLPRNYVNSENEF